MKICMINGSYPKDRIGGSELQTFLIGRQLARQGHEVHYLAIRTASHDKSRYEVDEGVHVHRFFKHENLVSRLFKIKKTIQELKIDICYVRIFPFLWIFYQL